MRRVGRDLETLGLPTDDSGTTVSRALHSFGRRANFSPGQVRPRLGEIGLIYIVCLGVNRDPGSGEVEPVMGVGSFGSWLGNNENTAIYDRGDIHP